MVENPAATTPKKPAVNRPKILIVDDRPQNLQVLEVLLQDLGAELVRASSGNEALAKTLDHEFALVLLDVQMPEMDGYETAELLRKAEATRYLPVIFISAIFSGDYYKIRGIETGAVDFIEKPIVPEILRGKVRVFLDLYAGRQKMQRFGEELEARVQERTAELADEIRLRRGVEADLQLTVQMLTQSNRELANFAYCCSHDLSEPLRTIVNFSQLLQQEYADKLGEEGRRYLGYVEEAALSMQNLVHGILGFSRIDAAADAFEPVDCNLVLQSVLADLDGTIRQFGATVVAGPLPTLTAVSLQISQLFQNLIANAIKFRSAEPPRVTIEAVEEEDSWTFRFADNGIGIEAEYFEKIFQMFHRLHCQSEFPGCGLGLALCRKIVEFHNGKIWVESTVGQGSCFCFTLGK